MAYERNCSECGKICFCKKGGICGNCQMKHKHNSFSVSSISHNIKKRKVI